MSCGAEIDDPFRCPTKWDLWRQVIALLPRGRAWQTHEGPGALAGVAGSDADIDALTIQQRYWLAFAEVLEHLHQRACALIEEMFCATATETRAEWGAEYGFPDTCEPWDNLCAKVRATGGSTCDYLAGLAARVGYVIECLECDPGAIAECATADLSSLCDCGEAEWIRIRIRTDLSPAATRPTVFAADAVTADCTPPCPIPPDAVVCLIERYKPAHVLAIYEVI